MFRKHSVTSIWGMVTWTFSWLNKGIETTTMAMVQRFKIFNNLGLRLERVICNNYVNMYNSKHIVGMRILILCIHLTTTQTTLPHCQVSAKHSCNLKINAIFWKRHQVQQHFTFLWNFSVWKSDIPKWGYSLFFQMLYFLPGTKINQCVIFIVYTYHLNSELRSSK